MAVTITISGPGRVSIRVDAGSRVDVDVASDAVRFLLGDAGDALSVYAVCAEEESLGEVSSYVV